jgi:hypothetical protein
MSALRYGLLKRVGFSEGAEDWLRLNHKQWQDVKRIQRAIIRQHNERDGEELLLATTIRFIRARRRIDEEVVKAMAQIPGPGKGIGFVQSIGCTWAWCVSSCLEEVPGTRIRKIMGTFEPSFSHECSIIIQTFKINIWSRNMLVGASGAVESWTEETLSVVSGTPDLNFKRNYGQASDYCIKKRLRQNIGSHNPGNA